MSFSFSTLWPLHPGKTITPFRLWPVLLGALLAQMLLLSHTYSSLLFHPGQYLIVDHYDGIKSYFSMATFLRQPLSQGLLVHGHNYPFGEYLFYTDSTPLVIVPLHWLVQTVPALQPYGLYLFDVFILAGLVVSTGLLVLILRRLAAPAWLAVLLAVALPWLAPQTNRLTVGHMNLSYTPAILFAIWSLQRLFEAWRENRPLWKHFLVLLAGILGASWIHLYFLPLIGGMLGFFAVVLLFQSWRTKRPWLGLALGTGATLLAALLSTWGVVQWADSYYSQRPAGSSGYDWDEWRFHFWTLFQAYPYNTIRFPFESTGGVHYEGFSYLTGFVLYGTLLVMVLAILKRLPRTVRLPHVFADDHALFLKYLVLGFLPFVFISLGEDILLDNNTYVVHNYLNVFRWIHRFTERVTQFRTMGRFFWPFWWALVLAFGWYVAHWRHVPGLRWVLLVLCGVLVIDTRDTTRHHRTDNQRRNLLQWPHGNASLYQLAGWLETDRYQALLPLPFYHTGTETLPGGPTLNLDPDDPHCNATYQLGMTTGLPLMSHKAARTVYRHSELLHSVLQLGGPHPDLLARLDSRPVLVFLDTSYYDGRNNYYRDLLRDRPEMLALFERTDDFVREQRLRPIRRLGSWTLYEWLPKPSPLLEAARALPK